MYYPFVRKALFQLDPERAHELTFQQLRRVAGTSFKAPVRQKVPAKPVTCMGSTFRSPLRPAAGLDKDGECIGMLGTMGFGPIEIGTVTPHPQPGNDEPRLFRLVDAEGLISRMGFSNRGVDNLVENVKKPHFNGVLGINIDKNRDIPVENDKDDYLIYMGKVYAYVGYITINISLSNTPELRTLQYDEALDNLLTAIKNKQSNLRTIHHRYIPVAVRIAPSPSVEELIQVAGSSVRHNIDSVIATNTTLSCSLVQGVKNCDQMSGLSDRPLQLESTKIIRQLSQELEGRLPIIGVGDIDSVIATREKIAVGATLVQIYSGFIFKDPPLMKEVVSNI